MVAIDGPAGAGKSTASKRLAKRLGYRLLDTGALYRSVAWVAREQGVSWDDARRLAEIAAALDVDFSMEGDENRVIIAGQDRSDAIRTPEMSQGASQVSALPAVRAALMGLQRRLGQSGGVVAEGRDIGTVVFPDAPVKIFLTASAKTRAQRRVAELRAAGHEVSESATLDEIQERDRRDSERQAAPLKQADDAVLVDSSQLGIDEVLDRMESLVKQRGA